MFHKECFVTPLSFVRLPCWRPQLEVPCLQSVSGGFPAGTWVRGTVRAGCGKRRTLKPIFRKSGRSTGSSWKTRACTGTWMRRWIWWFYKKTFHSIKPLFIMWPFGLTLLLLVTGWEGRGLCQPPRVQDWSCHWMQKEVVSADFHLEYNFTKLTAETSYCILRYNTTNVLSVQR